jgi:nucleoid-associated protein YgaU
MKTVTLCLFFWAVLSPAAAPADPGCAEGQDSCAGTAKPKSGFLGAVEDAQKKPALAPAGKNAGFAAPAESAVSASTAAAPGQEAGGRARGGSSNPAWLLLVGGGLAALFYYLKDVKRSGRKK